MIFQQGLGNSRILLLYLRFLLRIRWLGVRGYFLSLGILEFILEFQICTQDFQIFWGLGVSFLEFQNSIAKQGVLCHPLALLFVSSPSLTGGSLQRILELLSLRGFKKAEAIFKEFQILPQEFQILAQEFQFYAQEFQNLAWEFQIKEFSFEILEFCLGILDLRCPLNFALAAEKLGSKIFCFAPVG